MKRRFLCVLLMLAVFAAASFGCAAARQHVADDAWLLSGPQLEELEQYARSVSERYGVGIYILLIDDYTAYSDTDVFHAAIALYEQNEFGMGAGKDGALLLLSMAQRDYSFIVYGERANFAFNDEGRELMTRYFLDDFAENAWYDGCSDFIFWCGQYLAEAETGEPFSYSKEPVSAEEQRKKGGLLAAGAFLGPLPVAGIATLVMNARMKNVQQAGEASAYVVGALQLSEADDVFLRRTQSRRRIERESSSSGSKTQHSGGYSGTSGKF